MSLPAAAAPGGAYTPVVLHNGLAYVSAQLPRDQGEVCGFGKVGGNLTLEQAQHFARLSALQCLAALSSAIGGEDRIERLLKVTGYVVAAPGFVQLSAVVDGASLCFQELLGVRGQHARTTVGVAELPRGVAVEIEIVAAIRTV